MPLVTADAASRLLTSFSSFLTIAIHSILYHRSLYPATSFLTARAFNIPVHQSRHPAVCDWIRAAVAAVTEQIQKGSAHAVVLAIHSPKEHNAVLERWVFDVSMFPQTFGDALPAAASGEEDDGEVNWADVEEALRAALGRIAHAGEARKKLEDGCTFTLAVELRDGAEPPISHPQAWIPAEPPSQIPSDEHPHHGSARGGDQTTPIRAVQAGPLFFECWVEQNNNGQRQKAVDSFDVTLGSDTTF